MRPRWQRRAARELIRYARLCYDRRLVGASGGNLSVRSTGAAAALITASGVSLRDVPPEGILSVDGAGNVLGDCGGYRPSKETGLHLAVYRERPSVNAVVHVHPAYPIVYAARRQSIPLVTVSAQLKLRQGPLVPRIAPGSRELVESLAAAIRSSPTDATVFLMEGHGLVAAGEDLESAFNDAELASDTAEIAYRLEAAAPGPEPCAGRGVWIDLTAPLDDTVPTYPTDPHFALSWHARYAQNGVNVGRVDMGVHTGTHVDAPLHVIDEGAGIDRIALDRFAGPAVAFDVPMAPGQNILPSDLPEGRVQAGDIVVFRTGWERRSSTPSFFRDEWPGFHPATIQKLAAMGAKAIGGDVPSADGPAGIRDGFVAHRAALTAGIPIFEGLVNLDRVVGRRFFFVGFPLRLVGGDASPIRAAAFLREG